VAAKKKRLIIVFIIGILLLLVSAGTFFIFTFLASIGRAKDLTEALEKTDGAIASGYFYKAERHLRDAAGYAREKEAFLRILKRAYRISSGRQDMSLLEELSWKAVKRIGEKEELVMVAVYAGIRNDHLKRVFPILGTTAHSDRLTALSVEASLRSGSEVDQVMVNRPGFPFTLLRLLHSEDPFLYEEYGRETENPQLLLDSALLYAHNGDIDHAFQVVKQNSSVTLFDEPGLFIAYDKGEFEYARNKIVKNADYFPARTDLLILLGDMALLEGEYSGAKQYYNRAIESDEKYASNHFLNLSYIYQKEGDPGSALIYMKQAYTLFPGNKNVVIEAVKLLTALSKPEEAEEILTSFVSLNPDDPYATMLLLNIRQASMQPKKYRARLWDLFNEHPQDERICKLLVTYLFGIPDCDGAETALNIYQINAGEGKKGRSSIPWILHFRGLIAALQGNMNNAISFLTESLDLEDNEIVHYHRAHIFLRVDNTAEARDDLWKALRFERTELQNKRRFYSQAASLLGETYIKENDIEKAMQQIEYALEIYPENYHAQVLLKQLEENSKK
jgi:tetratricopeptide (TPR) repeat protein